MSRTAISGSVRLGIAQAHGAKPNVHHPVRCAYCDNMGTVYWFLRDRQEVGWVATTGLEWDHVWPEYLGGETTAENLVLACRECNRSKGHKTMAQWLCART